MADVKPLKLVDLGAGAGELREFAAGDTLPSSMLAANLAAFAGLAGVADRLPYFTGEGALSLTTLTALARTLLDDTTQGQMQNTLGLVKQTSATDTTAGALLTVGAFGSNGGLVLEVSSGSYNSLTAVGNYNITTEVTDGPPGTVAGFFLRVSRRSSGTILQEATMNHTGVITPEMAPTAYRTSVDNGTTWGSWIVAFTRRNILGTVSQSAGIPTGAVIERGSNANGEYVRYADGTQICRNALSTLETTNVAIGSLFRTGDVGVTLPANFVGDYNVMDAISDGSNYGISLHVVNTKGSSSFNRVVFGVTSTSQFRYGYVAIGRWY